MSGSKKYMCLVGDIWWYRRRVPKRVKHLDKRAYVKRSTKQTSEAIALKIVEKINLETEAF